MKHVGNCGNCLESLLLVYFGQLLAAWVEIVVGRRKLGQERTRLRVIGHLHEIDERYGNSAINDLGQAPLASLRSSDRDELFWFWGVDQAIERIEAVCSVRILASERIVSEGNGWIV